VRSAKCELLTSMCVAPSPLGALVKVWGWSTSHVVFDTLTRLKRDPISVPGEPCEGAETESPGKF
jgi:hypothetical protein